jgi:hypothetical protein
MIFKQSPGADAGANLARLIVDLNRFHPPLSLLPVFADNDAAKAANLKVGRGYVDPDGFVRRVMP